MIIAKIACIYMYISKYSYSLSFSTGLKYKKNKFIFIY